VIVRWLRGNPAVVWVAMIALALAGARSIAVLPSGIYPEMTFPRVIVVAHAGQLAPDLMQAQVTRPLEQALAVVQGVYHVRARTIRGAVELSLQLTDDTDPLIAQLATYDAAKGWGASNRGRYSNPTLDKLIEQAVGTGDDNAREKLLQQAMKMAMGDVALIPLHIQKNIWATRAGLSYVPTVGEDLRLIDVRPTK